MIKVKKISVIMGVYNDERFLKKSIESILTQSFTDFEFIICNDCSTDSSESIIRGYAEKDKRIIFLNNEINMGLANTLNKCIEVSSGKYIARMDSDDISLKDRLIHQVDYLEKNPSCSVVGTLAYYIDDNDNKFAKFNRKRKISLSDAVKMSQVIHPSVMMRKDILKKVQGYTVNENTRRTEDYDLWCKIMAIGGEIENLQTFDFLYREDLSGLNKRKYKYRIQEFRIKIYWMRKTKQKLGIYIYAIKPLFVGLLPNKLLYYMKRGK